MRERDREIEGERGDVGGAREEGRERGRKVWGEGGRERERDREREQGGGEGEVGGWDRDRSRERERERERRGEKREGEE